MRELRNFDHLRIGHIEEAQAHFAAQKASPTANIYQMQRAPAPKNEPWRQPPSESPESVRETLKAVVAETSSAELP